MKSRFIQHFKGLLKNNGGKCNEVSWSFWKTLLTHQLYLLSGSYFTHARPTTRMGNLKIKNLSDFAWHFVKITCWSALDSQLKALHLWLLSLPQGTTFPITYYPVSSSMVVFSCVYLALLAHPTGYLCNSLWSIVCIHCISVCSFEYLFYCSDPVSCLLDFSVSLCPVIIWIVCLHFFTFACLLDYVFGRLWSFDHFH